MSWECQKDDKILASVVVGSFIRYCAGGLTRAQLSHDTDREPGTHYEKSNLLLNRRAEMVGVTGANTVYHMGTLSRASKHNSDKNQQVSLMLREEICHFPCYQENKIKHFRHSNQH